jgi:hypothetical protein
MRNKRFDRYNNGRTTATVVIGVMVVLWATFWAAVVYTAAHFVQKYW